jgi:hypothetical protein
MLRGIKICGILEKNVLASTDLTIKPLNFPDGELFHSSMQRGLDIFAPVLWAVDATLAWKLPC